MVSFIIIFGTLSFPVWFYSQLAMQQRKYHECVTVRHADTLTRNFCVTGTVLYEPTGWLASYTFRCTEGSGLSKKLS